MESHRGSKTEKTRNIEEEVNTAVWVSGCFCSAWICVSVCCRMGYDLERFVGYVNEGLLCCVCRDVLELPLQAPCEHAYCDACISSWLIHHHSCPEDRLPLDISTLRPLHRYTRSHRNTHADTYTLTQKHPRRHIDTETYTQKHTHTIIWLFQQPLAGLVCVRYMRNDLSRLQIRCVNSGQGCDAVCCLETLHTHEDECPFTFISCSSTGTTALCVLQSGEAAEGRTAHNNAWNGFNGMVTNMFFPCG
jgi:E3 ubiquitin-protein ligase NRDP1